MNKKKTCAFLHLAVLTCMPMTSADTTAGVSVGEAGGTDDDSNDVVGFVFTVGDSPIVVSDLGFWDADLDGLNSLHDVAIYRQSDMVNIVQGTVPGGVVSPLDGAFRYVSVPLTVLDAGVSYQVVAHRPTATTDLVGFNFSDVVVEPGITIDNGVFINGTGELAFATTDPGVVIHGTNFKFEVVSEFATELTITGVTLTGNTLNLTIENIPSGQTFHLRQSNDGVIFEPLPPPVDITDATPQPIAITVDRAANPTLLIQVYEGASPVFLEMVPVATPATQRTPRASARSTTNSKSANAK